MFHEANADQEYRKGNYSAAIEEYLKIIDCGRKTDWVCYNLGVSYIKLKMWAEAEGYLKEAIKMNPKKYAAYYNLGYISMMSEDYKKALLYYKTTLALSPNDSDAIKGVQAIEQVLSKKKFGVRRISKEYFQKKTVNVLYYLPNKGFEVYSYITDNNGDISENLVRTVECKRKDTKKFMKIKEELIQRYKIQHFVDRSVKSKKE